MKGENDNLIWAYSPNPKTARQRDAIFDFAVCSQGLKVLFFFFFEKQSRYY